QVKSKLGKGSEFYFTVEYPLVSERTELQQNLECSDRIIGYDGDERYQILVVDDHWENRAVIQNLLEPLGFDVIEAENGREGLTQLQTHQPDLVIADLVMPEMDGFEFLQHIRNSDDLKHKRVIVSSASVAQEEQRMALDSGGDGFLAKPINTNALFAALADHLQLTWIYEVEGITKNSSEQLPAEVLVPPHLFQKNF
ncbi:MAG: response regulator, partial [Leptolyngbya sp. SIO3F4]|nr:response regulator [Leptolyngbya sp. SIO3F4]